MNIRQSRSAMAVLSLLGLSLSGCGGGQDIISIDPDEQSGADETSPAVGALQIQTQPDAMTHQTFARFEFSAENAAGFECQKDDGLYEDCVSPFYWYPLDTGDHRLAIRAIDDSGHKTDPAMIEWTVIDLFNEDSDIGTHSDVIPTSVQPAPVADNSWRGIFRVNCDFAHSSYDDPIVYPGQDNAAHLHRFYGNTLVDEHTDTTSLLTTGDSSCQGNTLNRSSYWVPALLAPAYDNVTGERLMNDDDEPDWKVVPAVVGDNDEAHEIFYYSAGVDELDSIEPIPLGLKMIAGDPSGMAGNEQDTSVVRWHCQSWESNDSNNPRWSSSIPECVAPDRLRMDIFFPSCWNGVDLDSDDHRSHMAYPVTDAVTGDTQCPQSHPVPIIRVSFHYAFGVMPDVYDPQTRSSKGWRLASDRYEVSTQTPGGMSLHGDWFNAWHPEALQTILDVCIQNGLDCHDGNLANGYRLSGTRAGSQSEPAIINKGMGPD